jgi:Ser/Thr protein kinase RdoA (MazF antagonist)
MSSDTKRQFRRFTGRMAATARNAPWERPILHRAFAWEMRTAVPAHRLTTEEPKKAPLKREE